MFENLKIIKRDGKKVDFNGTKIAIAIKKGFDSVSEDSKYTEKDINKVYNLVIEEISKIESDRIKIEEIQDMIEENLKSSGYNDVYKSFSEYRERRAQSRKLFFEEKKQHKFLKGLEDLSLRDGVSGMVDNPYETMVKYGSTISREFAKSYMMKKKYSDSIDAGEIYIHDLNFMPIGTTTSVQIDLEKLFSDGFIADNIHIREPKDIMSYSALARQTITLNEREQHGCQSIPLFDYYMAPGVLKTFKKQFRETLDNFMELTDFGIFAATNGIEREIERIDTIDFDVKIFDKYSRDAESLKKMFRVTYKIALKKTNKIVSQAMEGFVHDVTVMDTIASAKKTYPTINLGTDTSLEGRMIIDNLLDAIDFRVDSMTDLVSPAVIFKVKDGINFKEGDPNYDLYKKAIEISTRKKYPSFSFLDASFNKAFYRKDNKDTEVAYNVNNARVIDNIIDEDKSITPGRCLLSSTTINLPRIAIKNSKILKIREVLKKEYEDFYEELEEKMELVKEQLLDRFETQGDKKAFEFPFLIKEGILTNGELTRDDDRIRKVIKQGTLNIGFIGLEEALYALTGKRREEDKETEKLGLKIIKFMRNIVDGYSTKYNLNFTLSGIDEKEVAEEFMTIDKSIYGKLEGITDKTEYTESFYVKNRKLDIDKILEIESPYHSLTNGGHSFKYKVKNINETKLEEMLKKMKEKDIGYASIIIEK